MLAELKIFVISLKDSGDRRSHIRAHLKQKRLDYEFFDAIDGHKLLPEDSKKLSVDRAVQEVGRGLTPGEIGCALSHIALYEKLLEGDESEFLILEDDAELTDAAIQILARRDKFPIDWDMINLHCLAPHSRFGEPIWDTYRMATFRVFPGRTTAYLLSRAGAVKLLEHAYPVRLPADLLTGRLAETGGLNMYGIFPQIASSRPNLSRAIGSRKELELFKNKGIIRTTARRWLQKLVWRI